MVVRSGTIACMAAGVEELSQFDNIDSVRIFLSVAKKPGITLSDLRETLDLPRSTASRLVTKLSPHRKGLGVLDYVGTTTDRRAKGLRLTREGEKLCTRLERVLNAKC